MATDRAPAKRRRNAVYICGPDYTPGPRGDCLNPLHDHPLPTGYIAAADVAEARLRKSWSNVKCPDCGLYGWRPGQPLSTPYDGS
jgi:hypothetical protein